MTIERLKEAAVLAKQLLPFYDEDVFGWNGRKATVQMGYETFFSMFPDADIKKDRGGEYPYTASTMLDDVTFFCIMTEEERNELESP